MPSQRGFQWLEVEQIGDVTVVRFTISRLGDEHSQIIGEQLFGLVDNADCHKLVLNFGNVKSLVSTMLSMLVTLLKKVRAVDGQLALCDVDPDIYETLKILALTRLFRIHGEEREALHSLS